MIIRTAETGDAYSISRISCMELGYECSEEFVLKRLNRLDSSKEAVFAALEDGMAVGFIHAEIYELLYYEPMVNILGIAVSSAYRRRGIGKALMKKAEEWAKKSGINIIRLNSGAVRKDAQEFYRSTGFDAEKEQICFTKSLE